MLEIVKFLVEAIAVVFLASVLSVMLTFIYFLLKDYINRY